MQGHFKYFVFSKECVWYIICLYVCVFLHLLVSYNGLLDENHTKRDWSILAGMLGVQRLKSASNWIWQNPILQYLWVEITGTTFYTVYGLSIHIHELILQRERGIMCFSHSESVFSPFFWFLSLFFVEGRLKKVILIQVCLFFALFYLRGFLANTGAQPDHRWSLKQKLVHKLKSRTMRLLLFYHIRQTAI